MSKFIAKTLEHITKLSMYSKKLPNITQQMAMHSALSDATRISSMKDIYFNHMGQMMSLPRDQHVTLPYHGAEPVQNQQKRLMQQSLREFTANEERALGLQRHANTPVPPKNEWQAEYEPSKGLLQIRYQNNVFLMCTIDESEARELQRKLGRLLKRFGAGMVHGMHMFKNAGLIDAVLSPRKQVNFEDIKEVIKFDALNAGARSWDFVNYERGIINFQCDPLQISDVCSRIQEMGYRILNTDYGFSPRKPVILSEIERAAYMRFLKQLLRVPGLVEVYDNVKHPVENIVDTDDGYKYIEQKEGNDLHCS